MMVDNRPMATITNYPARLQESIDAAQVTVRDLADHLGVTTQAVYKVLRGQTKSLQASHHLKAAAFLGVDPSWLATSKGTRHPKGPLELRGNPEFPSIPIVQLTFEHGQPGHQLSAITGPLARPVVLPAAWYTDRSLNPDRMIATNVRGAAMEPTLYDGDVVVINVDARDLVEGEVFMIRLDDEPVVARLFKAGGSWWAHFDNPDQRRHPRRQLPQDTEILGRAVHRQSDRL
jgi:phage repressor protein C with HTH and peptisase S24 domain